MMRRLATHVAAEHRSQGGQAPPGNPPAHPGHEASGGLITTGRTAPGLHEGVGPCERFFFGVRAGSLPFVNVRDRPFGQVRRVARPRRCLGKRLAVDAETGEARTTFSSDDACDGVVLKACGNRRASVCPACAATYRADARHLVAAGLAGGKGVPEAIAAHPAVFVTLTAPSFGSVHSASVDRPLPARAGERRCFHDRPLSCTGRHDRDDPALGQPLCADCYGYSDHVLWHAHAGELWRRTVVYLPRALARGLGLTAAEGRAAFRLSFVKVVEYQSRGAIHLHAIVRADGPGRTCPSREVTSPALITALQAAARSVSVPYPDESGSRSGCARWGEQIDATVRRPRVRAPRLGLPGQVRHQVDRPRRPPRPPPSGRGPRPPGRPAQSPPRPPGPYGLEPRRQPQPRAPWSEALGPHPRLPWSLAHQEPRLLDDVHRPPSGAPILARPVHAADSRD